MTKQQPSPQPAVVFGRVSNNLKMGIVGLPNVGKSTLFNILTKSSARAENFPFCTINPEESRVPISDSRFDWLCDTYKPKSRVPAYLTIVDIAGLVQGASTGAGLGNEFLSHIRSVDAIYHVIRGFKDESIVHVEGEIDPIRDIDIICSELILKDKATVERSFETLTKQYRGQLNDKSKVEELSTLEKAVKCLQDNKEIRKLEWTSSEISILNPYQLLTAKEMVYLCNISKNDFINKKNKWLGKISNWLKENDPNGKLIPFSADYELEQVNMEGDSSATITKIIGIGHSVLNLCNYFTAGPDEVRSWTIKIDTKAPQAAGVIHTDFEKGFIMAEVMKYSDLHELGCEGSAKAAGKYYQKGRNYIVEDGDVIFFKFNKPNVSSKKK